MYLQQIRLSPKSITAFVSIEIVVFFNFTNYPKVSSVVDTEFFKIY